MFAELRLPVEFFGEVDLHGKPLKAISMVYLDIRERLAQFLLSIDPDNFTTEPEVVIEDVDTGFGRTEKSRVYTHFCSGKLFEQVTAMVRKQSGRNVVAICLILSIDETTLNTTRSRTGSPLTMFVANARGDSFRPIFLGYGPLEMPYSDEVLDEMLFKRGCEFQTHRDAIIDSVKRGALLKYMEFVVQPLYSFERDGAVINVGSGVNQKQFTAFFHVVGTQLDTKQADQFMGSSHASKHRKCRLCMELCTSCFCTTGRPVTKLLCIFSLTVGCRSAVLTTMHCRLLYYHCHFAGLLCLASGLSLLSCPASCFVLYMHSWMVRTTIPVLLTHSSRLLGCNIMGV